MNDVFAFLTLALTITAGVWFIRHVFRVQRSDYERMREARDKQLSEDLIDGIDDPAERDYLRETLRRKNKN